MIYPTDLETFMTAPPSQARTNDDRPLRLTKAERDEALTNLARTRSKARMRGDHALVALCDEQARRIAYPDR